MLKNEYSRRAIARKHEEGISHAACCRERERGMFMFRYTTASLLFIGGTLSLTDPGADAK